MTTAQKKPKSPRKRKPAPTSRESQEQFQRYHGALRRLQSKVTKLKIVGFDTEDYQGKTVSYCFYDGQNYFVTRDYKKAIAYIYNYPGPVAFVCHNLQYDIANLFKATKYRLVRDMTFASRLIKVTLMNLSPRRCYFMDSCSFYAGSLSSLGDLIGMPKLSGSPFDSEYVKMDAKIVYTFMSMIQDRLNADGLNLTLTLGSMAMADFRTNFLNVKKQITYNSPICLEAYYGGRVELFYKGTFEETVFSSDINSSYPTEMFRREYPDTSYIETSTLATHEFGIGRFTVQVPDDCFIPPLPYHSPEGRLFFPTGTVSGCWTYAEVRFALSKGCKILAESDGEGTRYGCRPFRDFIDQNYQARLSAKALAKKKKSQGMQTHAEDFEILYYKLKMNNLYGKFSQHKDKSEMTRDKKTPWECEKLGEYVEGNVGPFYRYRLKRKKAPNTANYMWGTYVTSYARISLMEKLYSVHDAGGTLLYCDTDSVMFAGSQAVHALDVSGDLGAMSVEEFDMAHFEMAKGYLLAKRIGPDRYQAVKLACKGVNQEYGLAYLGGQKVTYEQPIKLKAGLIAQYAKVNAKKGDAFMKEHSENTWRLIEKTQRTVYFKRKGDHGVTLPINVSEIEALEMKDFSSETQKSNVKKGIVIIPPEFKKEKFQKVTMPDGWEKAWFAGDEAVIQAGYERRGVDYLNPQRCISLNPGDSWFSGTVFGLERNPKGKHCYMVGLDTYDGILAASAGIVVAVPAYRFSPAVFTGISKDFNFIGKKIEFILLKKYLPKYDGKKYIENSPLELRGKILNQ